MVGWLCEGGNGRPSGDDVVRYEVCRQPLSEGRRFFLLRFFLPLSSGTLLAEYGEKLTLVCLASRSGGRNRDVVGDEQAEDEDGWAGRASSRVIQQGRRIWLPFLPPARSSRCPSRLPSDDFFRLGVLEAKGQDG